MYLRKIKKNNILYYAGVGLSLKSQQIDRENNCINISLPRSNTPDIGIPGTFPFLGKSINYNERRSLRNLVTLGTEVVFSLQNFCQGFGLW